MTTRNLFSLASAILLIGCAESDETQRDADASDYDRTSTARELADLDETFDHALVEDEDASGEIVLEQLEATVDGADASRIPDDVRDMLRDMAQAEPCPVRGVILARYSPDVEVDLADDELEAQVDGAFRVVGYKLDQGLIGDGEGIYGDGHAVMRFSDLEDDDGGFARLTYSREGDGFGTFGGAWTLDTFDGGGDVAGLWHDLADRSGGIGLGYWTRCY